MLGSSGGQYQINVNWSYPQRYNDWLVKAQLIITTWKPRPGNHFFRAMKNKQTNLSNSKARGESLKSWALRASCLHPWRGWWLIESYVHGIIPWEWRTAHPKQNTSALFCFFKKKKEKKKKEKPHTSQQSSQMFTSSECIDDFGSTTVAQNTWVFFFC